MSGVDEYRRMLQKLMPPGPALATHELYEPTPAGGRRLVGTKLALLLDWMATLLAWGHAQIDEMVREGHPLTAMQTLPAWYAEAGLPNPCQARAETAQEMRAQVLYQRLALGGATVAYFEQLLERLGARARVGEFQPFRVGKSAVGDAVPGRAVRFWWWVRAVDTSYKHFAAGDSSVGEPLQRWGENALVCLINTLKPAHTKVMFTFVTDEAEL